MPGEPVRTFRRTVGAVLAVAPFWLATYWAGVILGEHQPMIYLLATPIAVVVALVGRWILPRLTMT